MLYTLHESKNWFSLFPADYPVFIRKKKKISDYITYIDTTLNLLHDDTILDLSKLKQTADDF